MRNTQRSGAQTPKRRVVRRDWRKIADAQVIENDHQQRTGDSQLLQLLDPIKLDSRLFLDLALVTVPEPRDQEGGGGGSVISKIPRPSDAEMARSGFNTFAIVLCATGSGDADQLLERINHRLKDLGLAFSKRNSLMINLDSTSSLPARPSATTNGIAGTDQAMKEDYIRSPERECL